MSEELASRNVKFINFYDVVLDYILIDSFEASLIPMCSCVLSIFIEYSIFPNY